MNKGTTFSDEIPRLYSRIGDIAKELKVANSLIRFWMHEFHIEVKRSRNNQNARLFTAEDREKIREIFFLVKVQMFTLKGARKQLEGL